MPVLEGADAYDPHAELELARRARRGDLAAFDLLVLRFQRPVHRLCWRMLRSSNAEDLAQETFVRAFVHFDRFDPERPLLPWLLAIARRLCLDLLRREKVMSRGEEMPVTIDSGPGPERQASLKEGMSYRDIAATLEVPMGTVMTWLHRGRAQLKKTGSPE